MAACRFHEFHGIFTVKCGFFHAHITDFQRFKTGQEYLVEFGIYVATVNFSPQLVGLEENHSHPKLKGLSWKVKGASGPTSWVCLP